MKNVKKVRASPESEFPPLKLVTKMTPKGPQWARKCKGCNKELPDDDGFMQHYGSNYVPNLQKEKPGNRYIHLNVHCFTSYMRNEYSKSNTVEQSKEILREKLEVEQGDYLLCLVETRNYIRDTLKIKVKA